MVAHMTDVLTPLIDDLIDWVDRKPRTYAEAIDAWRTSCPRLPVWEEAFDRGLVSRTLVGGTPHIVLTDAGKAALPARANTARAASSKKSPWPIRIMEDYFNILRTLRRFEIDIRTGRLDCVCAEKHCPRCEAARHRKARG